MDDKGTAIEKSEIALDIVANLDAVRELGGTLRSRELVPDLFPGILGDNRAVVPVASCCAKDEKQEIQKMVL